VPRYLRGYIWEWESDFGSSPSVQYSLSAPALPSPPTQLLNQILPIVQSLPELFKVVCPIRFLLLKLLLQDHPNQSFVESVLWGLQYGFWPFAETLPSDSLLQPNHKSCDMAQTELQLMVAEETAAHRFSSAFTSLPARAQVIPLGFVPKRDSDRLRQITDMSAGDKKSINASIDKDSVAVKYDSLHHFMPYLLHFVANNPTSPAVLWKSDVAHAFRILPVHPIWQLMQISSILGAFYVDRCLVFGCSASPRIWCSFFSLILWIAHFKLKINLNNLMDDSWGVDFGVSHPFVSSKIP